MNRDGNGAERGGVDVAKSTTAAQLARFALPPPWMYNFKIH